MAKTQWSTSRIEPAEFVKISVNQRQAHFSPMEYQEVAVTLAAQRRFLHTLAVFPDLAAGKSPDTSACAQDLGARAHQILQEAEQEAQTLLGAARQKAASLEQEGYRDGLLQGRAEAFAEARTGIQQLVTALGAGAARLRSLEEEFRRHAGETVIDLALAVAERILRAEVARDSRATLRVVQAALDALPEHGEVVVWIHPDQCAMLQDHRSELLAAAEGATALRILGDPTVEAGGCRVETPGSLVDATLSGQLEEARRRLRGDPR